MAEDKKKPVNLHRNHRQRAWAQFEKRNGTGFLQHQLLEMLLFYSIPRRDTNPTAHLLLHRFGSLTGLLDAHPEELIEVDGVGPSTVQLLSLFPLIYDRYLDEQTYCSVQLHSYADTIDYLRPLLQDVKTASSYLLILDGRCRPKPLLQLTEGYGFTYSAASLRLISERILEDPGEINGIILVQKRFSGSCIPDTEDLFITKRLQKFVATLKVKLLDHIISVNGKFSSLKHMNMM